MLRSPRFARVSYTLFAVAVLAALLKLGGISGAKPFVLRMVPATPVAKATEPAAREDPGGEPLDLPKAREYTFTGSPPTGLASSSDKDYGDAPVFYRPSLRKAQGPDSKLVCGDLGNFPKSGRAVFPLSKDYFGSYDDTWGAPRPQGGHEGTDLMSPTGTPEFAVTDGTIVPVSGTNKNGWNRLGGYTVMLKAAYDIGPIKKGDLFYYAHMDQESALPIGTKVRAGQRLGVVGDTGEGSEGTRGKFPPHLHFGWYAGSAASARTNLKSGAMNPYPLLLWIETYGGAVTGGTDATYCEAPQGPVPSTGEGSWPAPDVPGTSPDLAAGSAYDARPSPAIEKRRHTRSPKRESGLNEKSDEKNGPGVSGERIGATGGDSNAGPSGGSGRNDGTGDGRDGSFTPGEDRPAASESRVSRPSVGDTSLSPKIREEDRSLLPDPRFRPDRASRPSHASVPADVLRKKVDRGKKNGDKKDHDGRDAGAQDKKKKHKKSSTPLEGKESKPNRPKPASGKRAAPAVAGKDRTSSTQRSDQQKAES